MLDTFNLNQIVEPLVDWFAEHARVLPWRDNPGAYEVWVSEIMLQQTRVETVKPYFERFIRALPDVAALAACPEDQYLKLWEGLGYYNRVRNLHAAAIQVMEQYQGVIPDDYEELLKLKGIGHYTAGAIASIAYNKPYAAVDGNVLRVISRVSGDDSDIMKQSVRTHMEEKLTELMRTYDGSVGMDAVRKNQAKPDEGFLKPGIFNQALMELGATVCLPGTTPHCESCPWQAFCCAYREDRTDELPVRAKAKERRIEDKTVFVIRDGDKVAIHKRKSRGLLAGLYELPNHEGHMAPEEALAYMKSLGYAPIRILPLDNARHIFSHVEWRMRGYAVFVEEPKETDGENPFLFVEAEDARERYAIPSAFAKYVGMMDRNLNLP